MNRLALSMIPLLTIFSAILAGCATAPPREISYLIVENNSIEDIKKVLFMDWGQFFDEEKWVKVSGPIKPGGRFDMRLVSGGVFGVHVEKADGTTITRHRFRMPRGNYTVSVDTPAPVRPDPVFPPSRAVPSSLFAPDGATSDSSRLPEERTARDTTATVAATPDGESNDGEPWYRFKYYCPKKIGVPSSSESGAVEILQVVKEEDENWIVVEPHLRVTHVDPIYKLLLLKRAQYEETAGIVKYQHEYEPWIALKGINGKAPFVWKAPAIRIPRKVKFEDRREPGGFYMGIWDSEKQRYTLGNWPSDGNFHLRHEKEQFVVGVECVSRLNTDWGSARNKWKVIKLE